MKQPAWISFRDRRPSEADLPLWVCSISEGKDSVRLFTHTLPQAFLFSHWIPAERPTPPSTENAESTLVFAGARFLKPKEVMCALGYTDRSAFWQAIKAAGIPFIRINTRRCLFEESAVRSWLDSKRIGGGK